MRSPNIWAARGNARPAAEMFICFANPRKRGDAKPEPLPPSSGEVVRLPGIFASARRKGNPFARASRPDTAYR